MCFPLGLGGCCHEIKTRNAFVERNSRENMEPVLRLAVREESLEQKDEIKLFLGLVPVMSIPREIEQVVYVRSRDTVATTLHVQLSCMGR